MPVFSKYPGKEKLKQLILENDGYQSKIVISLKKQGIIVSQPGLSKWIRDDKELNQLAWDMRLTRTRGIEARYPEKEELKRLIKKHEGYLLGIISSLKEQGIIITQVALSRLVRNNEELDQLAWELRQIRDIRKNEERAVKRTYKQALMQVPEYPGKRESAPQIKRIAAGKEYDDLPKAIAVTKEEDLILSEEEIEILLKYQDGDSVKVLVDKTGIAGGRVGILITSILIKKNVATLNEAKEKSKEELVAV